MKKLTALLLSILLTTNPAFANNLEEQRETYRKITQLLSISDSQPAQDLANALAAELQDYPLLPYVRYRLVRIPGNLTLERIQEFQQQYPHFPFNGDLNKLWQSQFVQPKAETADTRSAEIRELAKNPQNLPAFAAKQPPTAENKQAVITAFPAFVKTLQNKKWQNDKTPELTDPFKVYQQWAEKFRLNQAQIRQWRSALLWQIFDLELQPLQTWRDQQISNLKEDRQTERRLRTAIRKRQDLSRWLNLLSDEAKRKDEWQYWTAQSLAGQGKKEKSRQILTALAAKRGFYSMLASQDLNMEYRPSMAQWHAPKTTAKKSESSRSDKHKTKYQPVAKRFEAELARIRELRYLNEAVNVNREWKALLDRADFDDKLALAQYAQEQQWFDLGVEATIQAKAWDYISLRLPNAYLNWFDLHLKNKKIDRTFAMAIARQESAWRPAVISSANARGIMQLLPATAKNTAQKFRLPYNRESQLLEPFNNIMLGTAHLQELYDKYNDNRILIAAAYNAGTSRVEKWLAQAGGKLSMAEFVATIPFYETRGYVQNVLTYDYYYQLLQNKPLQKFTKAEYHRMY